VLLITLVVGAAPIGRARAAADWTVKNMVITAAFVYQTANREQMVPRKPLRRPSPPQRPTTQGLE
jgi:hypothetical protein